MPNHTGEYKKIDLKRAAKMAEAGANGVQIAAFFGVHPDTLYARVKKESNMDFSAWIQQKQASGDNQLLTKQFDVAMKGDKTMLIWLGKQRLKQADKQEINIDTINNVMPYNGYINRNARN